MPFTTSDHFFDLLTIVYLKLFLYLLVVIIFQVYFNSFFKFNMLLTFLIPILSWLSSIFFLPHNLPVYATGGNLIIKPTIFFREAFHYITKYDTYLIIYETLLCLYP